MLPGCFSVTDSPFSYSLLSSSPQQHLRSQLWAAASNSSIVTSILRISTVNCLQQLICVALHHTSCSVRHSQEIFTWGEVIESCDRCDELAAEARTGTEYLLQGLDGPWHQVAVVINQGSGQSHTEHRRSSLQGWKAAHHEKQLKTNHRKFYRAGFQFTLPRHSLLRSFAGSTPVFPLSQNQSAYKWPIHREK